jgi:hypothetical protein
MPSSTRPRPPKPWRELADLSAQHPARAPIDQFEGNDEAGPVGLRRPPRPGRRQPGLMDRLVLDTAIDLGRSRSRVEPMARAAAACRSMVWACPDPRPSLRAQHSRPGKRSPRTRPAQGVFASGRTHRDRHRRRHTRHGERSIVQAAGRHRGRRTSVSRHPPRTWGGWPASDFRWNRPHGHATGWASIARRPCSGGHPTSRPRGSIAPAPYQADLANPSLVYPDFAIRARDRPSPICAHPMARVG